VTFGSLGLSALVAAILHVNNIRDFDSDRAAGKRTLAHVLGRSGAISEFTTLVLGAFGLSVLFVLIWHENWPTGLVLLVVPAALQVIQLVRGSTDVGVLNTGVRLTAQLHFRFGLLFAAGLVIRALIERLD
jgi:1,4-dihydroxy-2-naphthoate octaprenyltransferase